MVLLGNIFSLNGKENGKMGLRVVLKWEDSGDLSNFSKRFLFSKERALSRENRAFIYRNFECKEGKK